MTFSTKQVRQLRARLKPVHVKEREVEGKPLHYMEGWYVIAEANRIFGFEGWDRQTLMSDCVWQKVAEGRAGVAYLTRVRITVRSGDTVTIREGVGSGEAFAPTLGQAHERAAKAAETDATKRALTTFGNSFGLSLYADKPVARVSQEDHNGHGRGRGGPSRPLQQSGLAHASADAGSATGSSTGDRAAAKTSVAGFRVSAPMNPGKPGRFLETVRPLQAANDTETGGRQLLLPVTAHVSPPQPRVLVDKSQLTLGEPKRLRSAEHLRFVARQPCLVCGRQPCQAHHLRYAQPRALARKVSDEFTVPLCPFHHDEVHRTGNEFQWWQSRGIDALKVAQDLWRETRHFPGSAPPLVDVEPLPGQTDVPADGYAMRDNQLPLGEEEAPRPSGAPP